jgi:hypothetical protein
MCSPQRSQTILRWVVSDMVRGIMAVSFAIRQSETILARSGEAGRACQKVATK